MQPSLPWVMVTLCGTDLLSTPAGVEAVEDHLRRLGHGVYK